MIPEGLASCLAVIALQEAAIALFAWQLDRRPRFATRAMLALALSLPEAYMLAWLISYPGDSPYPYVVSFASFAILFIVYVVAARLCWNIPAYTALFCCVCGYSLQNLASMATRLLWHVLREPLAPQIDPEALEVVHLVTLVLTSIAVYAVVHQLVLGRWNLRELERYESPTMAVVAGFVILVSMGLDQVNKYLVRDVGIPVPCAVFLAGLQAMLVVATLAASYGILVKQRETEERAVLAEVVQRRDEQFARAKTAVDRVNRRMHDARHAVLRSLAASDGADDAALMREVASELDVFDSVVHTGNIALDTVLAEQSLECRLHDIELTCIADGKALEHLNVADTYALVNSLLEDATRLSLRCKDRELRSIHLLVERRKGFATLHLEQPDTNSANEDIPQEAKSIAESYGGTLIVRLIDHTRMVDVLIPT